MKNVSYCRKLFPVVAAVYSKNHGSGQSILGQARIAAKFLVKLGIHVSPRTVQK